MIPYPADSVYVSEGAHQFLLVLLGNKTSSTEKECIACAAGLLTKQINGKTVAKKHTLHPN